MLLCSLFFGAYTAVLGYKAVTNDRGLILNGIIEFGAFGATAFYWILTVLSVLFGLVSLWTIFTTFVHGVPDVVLAENSISFPVGFPVKRKFTLPYSEIAGLSQTELNGQRFLFLHTATKKYSIVLNWLAPKSDELELQKELAIRLAEMSERTKL
jgi:hypothetical protein